MYSIVAIDGNTISKDTLVDHRCSSKVTAKCTVVDSTATDTCKDNIAGKERVVVCIVCIGSYTDIGIG